MRVCVPIHMLLFMSLIRWVWLRGGLGTNQLLYMEGLCLCDIASSLLGLIPMSHSQYCKNAVLKCFSCLSITAIADREA